MPEKIGIIGLVRKKLMLAVWVAGILFPMAWVSQQIPGYDRWFNRIFASQWMHILMHAFLYGMLAAGIILAWPKRNFLAALATAFWVGIFQEILQPLPAGLLPDGGALFDLLVDLAGAAAGVLVAKHLRSILSSRKTAIERKA